MNSESFSKARLEGWKHVISPLYTPEIEQKMYLWLLKYVLNFGYLFVNFSGYYVLYPDDEKFLLENSPH